MIFGKWILFGMLLIAIPSVLAAQPLLSPTDAGFDGQSKSANYDTLMDALYANGKATTVIGGDKLWVPWYTRSDSCNQNDLQSGNNCNSGSAIDSTNNCMVTDELSQVGILVAMGDDQTRMDQYYRTIQAIASTNGNIPAWRIYRNGDSIEPCREGINGNCDTASDGTARIIISLFTASKNPLFYDTAKKAEYGALAKSLTDAFLTYEVDQTCRPSSLGEGDICYWLAAGSGAKSGGPSSHDYAYTGYYADAAIAMLEACAQTGDMTYCRVAEDFTLNYLEASKFDGKTFTVPPGKSFRWVEDENGIPTAQCTSGCSPVMWDDADAPRAFGMCQANYYANVIGHPLPLLTAYCDAWQARHGQDTNSIPLQYTPDGNAASSSQSSYYAQGLQALQETGCSDSSSFGQILDNALGHYDPATGTWNYASCFGVYHAAFPVRALGVGIGRDLPAFPALSQQTCSPTAEVCDGKDNDCDGLRDEGGICSIESSTPIDGIDSLPTSCAANGAACEVKSDSTSGVCRTMIWGTNAGDIKVLGCEKDGDYVELYRQEAPSSASFSVCLANGCVTKDQGFARFIPIISTTTKPPTTSPSTTLPSSCTPSTESCDGKDNDCDGLIDENAVCASPSSINEFTFSVSPSGNKLSDTSDGSCRTVRYGTPSGEIQAKACAKGGGAYEMYLQQAANPSSVCVGSACVGPMTGFARFII